MRFHGVVIGLAGCYPCLSKGSIAILFRLLLVFRKELQGNLEAKGPAPSDIVIRRIAMRRQIAAKALLI